MESTYYNRVNSQVVYLNSPCLLFLFLTAKEVANVLGQFFIWMAEVDGSAKFFNYRPVYFRTL